MTDEILLEKRGKVAIITFNREKKLNALNAPLYYKLGSMMNDIAKMDDIYITVITGKGRYFSACVASPTSVVSIR
jgi:Delta3-Delta2-enoyl-CoA isomerase